MIVAQMTENPAMRGRCARVSGRHIIFNSLKFCALSPDVAAFAVPRPLTLVRFVGSLGFL